ASLSGHPTVTTAPNVTWRSPPSPGAHDARVVSGAGPGWHGRCILQRWWSLPLPVRARSLRRAAARVRSRVGGAAILLLLVEQGPPRAEELAPPDRNVARAEPVRPPRSLEFNIVPVLGGDSDIGIGGGEVADLARLDPRYHPYRWKLESGAFITFKQQDGGLLIPFQDYYLVWTLPDLTASR